MNTNELSIHTVIEVQQLRQERMRVMHQISHVVKGKDGVYDALAREIDSINRRLWKLTQNPNYR